MRNKKPGQNTSAINSNTWDKYWLSGNPDYPCHPEITKRVLKLTNGPNDIIVEIGSGLGVDAIDISSSCRTVIALDLSREALKLLKSKIEGIKIIPVLADALSLPFRNDSVDLFYHQGVMEHFPNPAPFLLEQKRSLKSSGVLIVDVPQTFTLYTLNKKWAISRNKWFAGWETQYSPRKLSRLLRSNGFQVKEIYGRGYDLAPLVWIRDIERLGTRRFGRPIIPMILARPISRAWRYWESLGISNYLKHCIGAVAIKKTIEEFEKFRP
jgi:SAM-dependent methyltransferase